MSKKRRILRKMGSLSPLLLISIISWGQPFNFGVFGGITASQVQGDSYTGYNKLGVSAGGFVNQHIAFDISWQVGLKYVMRGVYQGPDDYDQNLYKSTYHYLELPLSAFYLFNEKFQLELGISPEVLLQVIYRDGNGEMNPSNFPENRQFGLSVFAELGYWFSPSMGMGLRYTNSAFPFREPQEWNNAQYRGFFHSVISLSLAFKIRHE